MNKTIASLALLAASTSAYAIVGPGEHPPKPKVQCIATYEDDNGNLSLGDCDHAYQNKKLKLPLKENGCAEGQASLVTFNVKFNSCPGPVQL